MTKEIATVGKLRGIETMDTRDLILPRVLLMQKGSKFVDDLGAKPGSFYNSLTKTEMTDMTFIPIVLSKYWDLLIADPESDRMKFDKRVFAEPEGRKFFSDDEGKADCNVVLSYISLFGSKLMLIPFSKSSYPTGKTLLTLAANSGQDLFSNKYRLLSSKRSNGDYSWYAMDLEELGTVTPEEHRSAEIAYNALGKKAQQMTPGLDGETVEDVPF